MESIFKKGLKNYAPYQHGFIRNQLCQTNLTSLGNKQPWVATFYCRPKFHKGLHPLKSRPIMSGVGSLTQNYGIYIDEVLFPFVESLPSYTMDTTDFLKQFGGLVVDQDIWLASTDMEVLYISIPHTMGIYGVEYLMDASTVSTANSS